MITTQESQKVARWSFFYGVDGSLSTFYKSLQDVKEEYADILNIGPQEVEIRQSE